MDAQTYNHVTCQWENVVYIGYLILSTQAHDKESKKVVGNSSRDHEINVTGELKKNRRKAEEEVTSEAKRMKWEDNSGDREVGSGISHFGDFCSCEKKSLTSSFHCAVSPFTSQSYISDCSCSGKGKDGKVLNQICNEYSLGFQYGHPLHLKQRRQSIML